MSSYRIINLEIQCNDLTEEMRSQLLECFGIKFEKDGNLRDTLNEIELDTIYAIVSSAFGDTSLYYYYHAGNSVCDWYAEHEVTYNDNNSGKKESREYEYMQEEVDVWDILQDEIEKQAKERNIEISWCKNDDGSLYPDYENDEFYDLCSRVYSESGGEEELCTERRTGLVSDIWADRNELKKALNQARLKHYYALAEILEKLIEP